MEMSIVAGFWVVSFLLIMTPGADWAYAISGRHPRAARGTRSDGPHVRASAGDTDCGRGRGRHDGATSAGIIRADDSGSALLAVAWYLTVTRSWRTGKRHNLGGKLETVGGEGIMYQRP